MTVETTGFTRTIEGRTTPAPGKYVIDPAHTRVGFVARHMMVSKVRGHFGEFEGSFTVGERPEDSSVNVTVHAASIDTNQPDRDGHLRSADFLHTEEHPTLAFRSTSVEPAGDSWQISGDLTIRGTTRPAVLDVDFEGATADALGDPNKPRAGFTASTRVNRHDFGLAWDQRLETGGFVVGPAITIELEVEGVGQ
ncbi:MAG: YceI family protein [Streptosporangiaceae bacterium]